MAVIPGDLIAIQLDPRQEELALFCEIRDNCVERGVAWKQRWRVLEYDGSYVLIEHEDAEILAILPIRMVDMIVKRKDTE